MRLLLERNEKRIVGNLYDDRDARIPDFTLTEKVPLEVGLCTRTTRPWDSRIFTPVDLTGWTIRAAIGSFREPVGGTFEVSFEGTASDILVPAANTTAADLENAMNDIPAIITAGGLVVTGQDGFFVISFNLVGARSIFMADATQAIPSLLLTFTRLVIGDGSNRGVQTLRIEQNIASLADLDTISPSAPAAFTVVAATDLFTSTAHGLVAGDKINVKSTGTLPAGLSASQNYFVSATGLTANDFKLSTTAGGSTVDVTTTGTGTHTWFTSIVEELVPGGGGQNEKVRVTLPIDRWGGEWTLNVAGQSSDLIDWDTSAQVLQILVEAIPGVGSGNVQVIQDGDDSFILRFRGSLVNTAIAVSADPTALKVQQTAGGTLDLQNAQCEFLLDGPESSVVTLELELTDPDGNTDKVQSDVMLKRPVVKLDSVIAPFPASNYYTKDQIDALLAGIAGQNQHAIQEFSATALQTTYALTHTATSTPIVFIRGLLQSSADFTVPGNTSVVLNSGADIVAGDEVLIFYFY